MADKKCVWRDDGREHGVALFRVTYYSWCQGVESDEACATCFIERLQTEHQNWVSGSEKYKRTRGLERDIEDGDTGIWLLGEQRYIDIQEAMELAKASIGDEQVVTFDAGD